MPGRLSRGLQAQVNYQYALERGSAFNGFRYGRTMDTGGHLRHAIKTNWDWTVPVGRGQRFGSNLHPLLDGILGGWSMNGVGRIQASMVNFGNVRLVGMTKDELQDMYKFYFRDNAATNIREVADAGADTFVAGSAIFTHKDYKAAIDAMRAELARA